MAFGGGSWPQTCRVCTSKTNPDASRLRQEWGCDAPTEAPQFEVACVVCDGKDSSCQDCGGSGRVAYHRCPFHYVQPIHWDLCRAADLLEDGVLPAAGGWADQAATFVDGLMLVRRWRAEYRKKAEERAAEKARRRRGNR